MDALAYTFVGVELLGLMGAIGVVLAGVWVERIRWATAAAIASLTLPVLGLAGLLFRGVFTESPEMLLAGVASFLGISVGIFGVFVPAVMLVSRVRRTKGWTVALDGMTRGRSG